MTDNYYHHADMDEADKSKQADASNYLMPNGGNECSQSTIKPCQNSTIRECQIRTKPKWRKGVREERRVIQKRYYERQREKIRQAKVDLEETENYLNILREENASIKFIGSCLENMSEIKHGIIKADTKRAATSEPKSQLRCNYITKVPTVAERAAIISKLIEKEKQKLQNSTHVDLHTFKENVCELLQQMSKDRDVFMHLVNFDRERQGQNQEYFMGDVTKRCYKTMIQSMSADIDDEKIQGAVDRYNHLMETFEKMTSFVECVFNPHIAMVTINFTPVFSYRTWHSRFLHLLQRVENFLDKNLAFLESLAQLFTPEQYANVWIQNNQSTIPDPIQIIHWICESRGIPIQ